MAAAFCQQLRKGLGETPSLEIDRLNRLLSYVCLRQSEELVEVVSKALAGWAGGPEPEELVARLQRKGTVMHCLEILLRNGIPLPPVGEIPESEAILLWPLPMDDLSDPVARKRALCFIWVPGGLFRMGPDRLTDGAEHKVEISRGFWMAKHAITVADILHYGEAQNGTATDARAAVQCQLDRLRDRAARPTGRTTPPTEPDERT